MSSMTRDASLQPPQCRGHSRSCSGTNKTGIQPARSAVTIDARPGVRPMLIRTRLFQRCPVLQSLQEGDERALSADAGPINGTYCRRYRDAAVATRASFNENPWELMRNNNR